MLEHGWTFADGPGVTPDPVMGAKYAHQLYTRARPGMTGRVTVPLLWDTSTDTIVSNESSEIICTFNTAYADLGARSGDHYPEALREEIERSEEHTSELPSLMRNSYAVYCLKQKTAQ